MSDDVNFEELLRETFADMAREEEPPPPERFLRETRRPLLRRAWRPLAAAAAVVVLIAATVAILRGTQDRPDEPDAADAGRPVPVAELWPHAVHALPQKLPNGLDYRPELFLDAHTLLARTGKASAPVWWTYDVRTRGVKRLVRFTPPPRTDFTSPVVEGGGRLVWYTVSWGKTKGLLDIWTVPVTGGAPRKVTSIRQTMKYGDIDLLSIVGDQVVWSRGSDGGVYRVPLSGGKPAAIPDTTGFHLLQWPWAGVPERLSEPPGPVPRFRKLANVLTGERRDAAPGAGYCSLSWCLTQRGVRPRLGGPERSLPARPLTFAGPALDRFLVLLRRTSMADNRLFMYDLKTGRTADLGIHFEIKPDDRTASDYMEAVTMYPTTRLLTYDLGGRRMVVDLPAIP